MGTNNIPSAVDSTVIPADHHNKIREAAIGDWVPRNASANAEDAAGNIGTSAYRWLQGYIKKVFIGSVADNISLESDSGSLLIKVGGNTRATFPSAHNFLPSGMVVEYAGTGDVGTEWLLCDGREVSRITYSRLFTAIGVTHGEGNGTTTFNIPDRRGLFSRGLDDMGTARGAAGRDPDAATRTALLTGGNSGNNVGSYQAGAVQAHTHATTLQIGNNLIDGSSGTRLSAGTTWGATSTNDVTSQSTGGNETRPVNVYVNYLIKT